MKRTKIALLSLAILLVSVTSSFATVVPGVWSGTTGQLYNGDVFNPSELSNLSVQAGTYTFNVSGVASGFWGVQVIPASTAPYYTLMAEAVGGFANSSPIVFGTFSHSGTSVDPFSTSASFGLATGIYSFKLVSAGSETASWWSPTSASISGSQPIGKAPIPAAALLLGSGVLGLFGVNKTRKTRSRA